MGMEVSSDSAICYRCGTKHCRRKGFFPVSYAISHKGVGYIPICKSCIDTMYNTYLAQCNDVKAAVRQMCRKLDLYWNDSVYELVLRKSTTSSMMTQYIAKLNSISLAGKSYDDTLSDEGTLWNFFNESDSEDRGSEPNVPVDNKPEKSPDEFSESERTLNTYIEELNNYEVTKDVIAFWGAGYTADMYAALEQRRAYWMSKLPDDSEVDIGMEAIIRQICSLELDINRDRAAGKAVDKSINALNTLLGSANWKPAQKKDAPDDAFTNPLGVWLYRYENERPLPQVDNSLKDVNKLKKNVFTWMGHLCKMLNKKNGYTKLYEDEMQKWRVEKPEYSDIEDDEVMMAEIFSSIEDGDSS